MSKEEDWQDLWAHTETAFGGKVSLLVNNAGVNPTHGWKLCVNIMLTGVGYGTFLALEKMGTSKVCLISVIAWLITNFSNFVLVFWSFWFRDFLYFRFMF